MSHINVKRSPSGTRRTEADSNTLHIRQQCIRYSEGCYVRESFAVTNPERCLKCLSWCCTVLYYSTPLKWSGVSSSRIHVVRFATQGRLTDKIFIHLNVLCLCTFLIFRWKQQWRWGGIGRYAIPGSSPVFFSEKRHTGMSHSQYRPQRTHDHKWMKGMNERTLILSAFENRLKAGLV